MIGGGTCDGTKKTCASLPSCTVKGGSCSGSTAINCIFDSAQNGGEGALVQTTQTCGENVPCVQYSDDGTTYAVCKETITFKFTVNGVETPYDISTLGTCLEMGGQKVLGRAYKTADHKYSARTITCHNDCVTNPDGFSYCK